MASAMSACATTSARTTSSWRAAWRRAWLPRPTSWSSTAMATTLGDCAVALLRGHGNVVVGGSIREVVFRAVYTEVNAKLATEALRLGQGRVTFLSEAEAKASTETNRAQIGRPWELWKA